MPKESWYINESELDDYQVQIVRRNLESSFIVKGCAGSGKTVLALWRAKEIAELGEDDYLVIVFTKALKQFIEDGIKTIGVDESRVMYFWQWKNLANQRSADYIIVDEVQDFDAEEIQMLQAAANKHCIFFGDTAQQIYDGLSNKGPLLTMEQIQIATSIPMENLVINHRLKKKVARIAELVSISRDPLEQRCSKEGSSKPHLVHCDSLDEQLDYIQAVIQAQGYVDVAILFPENRDVEYAYSYFSQTGLDVERKTKRSMDLNFSTSNPKILTYHSAKGLQFEAVFIPNCIASSEGDRNPLYVALTRTYRDLFILHSGNLSPFLAHIDKTLFELHDETSLGSEDSEDLPF